MTLTARGSGRRAQSGFTLVELICVILILAIMAGVVAPKYFNLKKEAENSLIKGVLGNTRAAIQNFYATQAMLGSPRYPTLTELRTVGTVMMEPLPKNPLHNSNVIVGKTWNASNPPQDDNAGWCYDSASGRFWSACNDRGANTW